MPIVDGPQESVLDPDFDASIHPIFNGSAEYSGPEEPEEPLRPLNWNLLSSEEAEAEWLDLNAWVDWLRSTYGLPPTVIPPFWHRHDELIWELSALHLHWLNSYDPDGSPSAPFMWHRDFYEARQRLRDWVATCGTRLDRDRATRQATWPGEDTHAAEAEVVIEDRGADFIEFVVDDVAARRRIEERVRAAARTG